MVHLLQIREDYVKYIVELAIYSNEVPPLPFKNPSSIFIVIFIFYTTVLEITSVNEQYPANKARSIVTSF